jgi:hypothetical protein
VKRFLSWFRGPGGALIGVGLIAGRWVGFLWHRLGDWELAQTLWVEAGGSMPPLVTIVSAWWFSPALIVAGFAYTLGRWRVDKNQRGRAYGQLIDRVGWVAVIAVGLLVLSTIIFDSFLTESGAPGFAKYVNDQRIERHLKPDEVEKIFSTFKKVQPAFKNIAVFAIDTPEAITYGREFMATFFVAGQTVNGKGPSTSAADLGAPYQGRLYSTAMRGLFVGTATNQPPSAEALRFASALNDAGFTVQLTGWDGLGPDDFNFIIGPK